MKKFLVAAALTAAGTVAAANDAALGIWQTQVDDGAYAHVEMTQCGAAVCGVIARTFNAEGEYQSENIGKTLVIDMVPAGDGSYEGSVWRPSNDRIYIGKMQVAGNQLRLRGCIAGGLLCSSQDWVRLQ
jgi:uncharacterized protein (DUF2147 family)